MGLSKRYLDTNAEPLCFDPEALGRALEEALPEVRFLYLLGSATEGVVKPHSDLDLAVYLARKTEPFADGPQINPLGVSRRAARVVEEYVGDVRCDLGFLDSAEPIYRFEALKGRLLFCREREEWLRFYSVTSREYEHQLFHYEKQRVYRLQAAAGTLS